MSTALPMPPLRYRREPVPRIFPVEEEMPETRRHLELRTLLFHILQHSLGHAATVGSDQFIYWNAANPKLCLSPDVFVRLGVADHSFDSWQTWVSGAPELAVEFISRSDRADLPWETKLARYHELGVTELLRFDPDQAPGERIRAFDRIDGDLVERLVETDETPSVVLSGMSWMVAPADGLDLALRLRTAEGALLETRAEAKTREAEAKTREAEAKSREAEASAREVEVQRRRVAELEAELRRRGG